MAMRYLFAGSAILASSGALACFGAGTGVRFAGQTNLIIWDDVNKIEHFVRDSRFVTSGKDLGFIAPTPTEPELSEVKSSIFRTLESFSPIQANTLRYQGLGGGGFGGGGGVQVLQEKSVGGYKATVLKADNGKALYDWLSQNGYRVSETSRPWLAHYVAKRWCFAAFKVERKAEGDAVATGPVRLSFRTERPYNPYYVPQDNFPEKMSSSDRLTLFLIGRGRLYGRIGGATPWKGAGQWKIELNAMARDKIASEANLQTGAILEGSTLTKYVDDVFPRLVKDDVFFEQVYP